jgi:hypothetical protein
VERRALVIDIKAVIRTAISAAENDEWGYDSRDALDTLREIDPERDWEYELFEAELEAGHRTMGPRRPSTLEDRAMMEMYGPLILAQLSRDDLFFKMVEKDGYNVIDKRRSFTIPIEIDKKDP